MVIKKKTFRVIDLYRDDFTRPRKKLIDSYKKLVTWAESLYIISPVWWFRLTPRTEIFFDEVFTPGFAYQFIPITKTYSYPKPFLKNKKLCKSNIIKILRRIKDLVWINMQID